MRVSGRAQLDLIPLMKRFIAPGSRSAYTIIPSVGENWLHYWVNHEGNFVCPYTQINGAQLSFLQSPEPVSTQVIERHWRDVKSLTRVYSDKGGAIGHSSTSGGMPEANACRLGPCWGGSVDT